MNSRILAQAVLVFGLFLSQTNLAQPINIPVRLQYKAVESILERHLFTGTDHQADLLKDDWNCNVLSLKNPLISSGGDGQVLLDTELTTRGGTPIGNRCIPLFLWSGHLRSQLVPYVSADGTTMGFRIAQSTLNPTTGTQKAPGMVWDLVKTYVHPELERFTVDLKPVVSTTRALLGTFLVTDSPGASSELNQIVDSVAFSKIDANVDDLLIELKLDLPDTNLSLTGLNTDVLSEQELAQWDAAWQAWDAFSTWLVKELASQLGPQQAKTTEVLATSLLEARYDLRLALSKKDLRTDPVRSLFVKFWDRLTPILQTELEASPELDAFRYLSFMSAIDALVAVDSVAESFAVKFDSETLRALARLISPAVTDMDLQYSTAVDPELRKLLGFDATLYETEGLADPWSSPLALLIPNAYAGTGDAELVKKLTDWVPARKELDGYLATVHQLLTAILDGEKSKGKVPASVMDVYENLMLATAWQESCWRQYEKRNGKVTPLKSSAGSLGLMQVNQHVWRGIYDTDRLYSDIAYNARAGNEILVHYLVDYAIKKKEDQITGDINNLARSTYAIYNGGPGHISRYRNDSVKPMLKHIDAAFLKKYRQIQTKGVDAIKSCYGS